LQRKFLIVAFYTHPTSLPKTAAQLFESAPWKIASVSSYDAVTGALFGSYVPDSMKNVVFTFNTDNTFTETGAKTASGTWVMVPIEDNMIAITTNNTKTKIDWTYVITANTLSLSNPFLTVTYTDPLKPSNGYIGEELSFTH